MDSKDIVLNARQEREYKGYNLFDQVDNLRVRTWNQLNTFLNIIALNGRTVASEYLTCLADNGRAAVAAMVDEMKQKGYTKLHKEVWNANDYS